MATTSRIQAVKSKINDLLEADAALTAAGVPIHRGGHPGQQMQVEHIWIDRVRFTENPANLGGSNHKRDQDITVELFVRTEQAGDDAEAVDDRCLLLVNHVEEALRADPRLGGEALYGGVTAGEQESWQEDTGRVSAMRLDVTYRARKGA